MGAPVGGDDGQVADHQARGVDFSGFAVLGVHPGVAHMRIGKGNDLPAVARIGENFLVAGHRSVEYHFTHGAPFGTDTLAMEHSPVGKR